MGEPTGQGSASVPMVEHVNLADHRITLRAWSRGDAWFMAEARADAAIRRYNGDHDRQGNPGPPPSTAEAEAIIDQYGASWRTFARSGLPVGVVFLITDTASGEPVGCCGIDDWTGEDVAQVGYWIAAPARRQGYASRALTLLTRWLFELGAARVFLTVVAGNHGSAAVARGAGFVHEGTMRSHSVWQGRRYDVLWFSALATEWTMPGNDSSPRAAPFPGCPR